MAAADCIALRPAVGMYDEQRPGFASALFIRLDDLVFDDVKRTADARERLQFVAGNTPKLRLGSRTIDLTLSHDAFRNEMYASTTGTSKTERTFRALLSHRAVVQGSDLRSTATDDTAATEQALANLQNSLATYEQERQAKQANFTATVLPAPRSRYDAMRKEKLDRRLQRRQQQPTARAATQRTSPSAGHAAALPSVPALTSQPVGVDEVRTKAMKTPVLHLLSIAPATLEEIRDKTHIPTADLTSLLPKIARDVDGKWQLTDKAFKDLDVWNFRYPSEAKRQSAIESAVRAFDRLRLSKDDKLWQMLLPEEKRDKGIVLSRLHLNNGGTVDVQRTLTPRYGMSPNPQVDGPAPPSGKANAAGTTTPRLGPSTADLKKRLLSKNPQKARAAEEAKGKKKRERDVAADERGREREREREKPSVVKPGAKKANIKSAEFVHSSADEDEEEGEVRETGKARPTAKAATGSSDSSDAPLQSTRTAAAGAANTAAKPRPPVRVNAAGAVVKPRATPTNSKAAPRPAVKAGDVAKASKNATTTPGAEARHARTPSASIKGLSPAISARARVASDAADRAAIGATRASAASPKGLGITNAATSASAANGVRKRHDTVTSNNAPMRSDLAEKKATTAAKATTNQPTSRPVGAESLKRKALSPPSSSSPPDIGSNKHRRTESGSTPSNKATSAIPRTKATTTTQPRTSDGSPPQGKADTGIVAPRAKTSIQQANGHAAAGAAAAAAAAASPRPPASSKGSASATQSRPTVSQANGNLSPPQDEDDGIPSIIESMTFAQGVAQAEQFRDKYYPIYAALYEQIEAQRARGETPDDSETSRLWQMHRRLERMKKEIALASRRGETERE